MCCIAVAAGSGGGGERQGQGRVGFWFPGSLEWGDLRIDPGCVGRRGAIPDYSIIQTNDKWVSFCPFGLGLLLGAAGSSTLGRHRRPEVCLSL